MKYLLILIITILTLGAGTVLAQEQEVEGSQDVPEDDLVIAQETTEVTPEDLGVSDLNILPDSPFYFLKEWGRNIQSFFTFNSVKKAQLKEKFANEKLVEVKKMVEQNKTKERVEKAIQNYQVELEEAKQVTEKIRERAEENEQVGEFLDKFIQHQALHQQILQKLETQVPQETFQKIKQVREQHLEKFGEVINKLQENKEQLQERLEQNLKEKNAVGILNDLENMVPEETKETIRRAKENIMKIEWIQTQEQKQEQEQTGVKPAPIPGKTIQQQAQGQEQEQGQTGINFLEQKIIEPIKGLFFQAKTEMKKGTEE